MVSLTTTPRIVWEEHSNQPLASSFMMEIPDDLTHNMKKYFIVILFQSYTGNQSCILRPARWNLSLKFP